MIAPTFTQSLNMEGVGGPVEGSQRGGSGKGSNLIMRKDPATSFLFSLSLSLFLFHDALPLATERRPPSFGFVSRSERRLPVVNSSPEPKFVGDATRPRPTPRINDRKEVNGRSIRRHGHRIRMQQTTASRLFLLLLFFFTDAKRNRLVCVSV